MKTGILMSVLIYEFILIGGIGFWIYLRERSSKNNDAEFELGGRNLPAVVIAPTLALTVLGAAHILGMFEMAWFMGGTAIWFSLAHVVMIAIVCLSTGLWARRLKLNTVPQLLEELYGPGVRVAIGCVMAGTIFGILTIETQGLGILLSAMTGWEIKYGAWVGGVLGVLYVILAGMKEVGWINLVNAILMYISVIIATIYLALALPGADFSSVSEFYTSSGNAHMLTIFGSKELMLTFAVGITIALIFSQPVNQMLLQVALSAKSEKTIIKSLWFAAPLNAGFGIFIVVMGMTAKSIPEFNALGPKVAAPVMLISLLPPWLSVMLIASFTAAILSTFAMTSLTPATIFTFDIYKRLFNPAATERQTAKMTRMVIVVLAIIAMAIATFLPPILASIGWLLAWLIPVFWLIFVGLFWKASTRSAVLTIVIAWGMNSLWSFTPLPQILDMANLPNSYIVLASTLIVGLITNFIFEGRKGYFSSAKYKIAATGFSPSV